MDKGYGRQRAEDQYKKTVFLRFNVDGNLEGNSDINRQGQNLERVNTFKYLGATLAEKWRLGCGDDAYNTIRMGNWKMVSWILCDRRTRDLLRLESTMNLLCH